MRARASGKISERRLQSQAPRRHGTTEETVERRHEEARRRGVRLFFTGVGGQGTLVATRLVGEAALAEGLSASMSEIHGMAQRGGVVESSVVVGDIRAPIVAEAQADVLVAFEPLEALRALNRCHAQTKAVVSTSPIVPFTVAAGQGTYPDLADVLKALKDKLAVVVALDAEAMAREAGSVRAANMVVMGAVAAMDVLPITKNTWDACLRKLFPPKLYDLNQRAFDAGFTYARP